MIVSAPTVFRAARRRVVIASFTLLMLLMATAASADTVRVTVERALIWNRPDGISVVLSQVKKDTVLQMLRRIGDWYEIALPPGSSRDTRDVGYIRASQVVVESGDVPSGGAAAPGGLRPTPAPTAPAKAPPASGTAPQSTSARSRPLRSFVNVDAAYRTGSKALKQTVPAFEEMYAEAGQIATDYGRGTGLQLDLMGGRTVWGQIGFGFGFSYYRREQNAHVDASIPHPFYFNQPRAATFTTPGLKREEIGLYIPILWRPEVAGPVKVMVFGGPAFFRTEQVAVTGATVDESYPYDVAGITEVQTTPKNGTSFGFNSGVDVAYMISRTVGVGVAVHYGLAAIEFRNDSNATTEGDAGGLQILVGLRYRF